MNSSTLSRVSKQNSKKYNTVQCDKRNSYRRKIREEKAGKTGDDGKPTDSGAENGDGDADASMMDATEMSAVNGRSRTDDEEPPSKKMRREAGEEDVSEEGDDEEFHDALEGEDEEVVDDSGEEDIDGAADEEEESEGDGADGADEEEERIGDGMMRDEALDDASEDSD